jgi:hypothetical protein
MAAWRVAGWILGEKSSPEPEEELNFTSWSPKIIHGIPL